MTTPPNIYAPAFDYDGNLTPDIDAAIISIINPVGNGTTINSQGVVVPKPFEFTPTDKPSLSNALIPPGKKSPYVEPPILLGLPPENIPSFAGAASTHRLSPMEPVIVKTSVRTEFDDLTNTMKQTTLIVGIKTTGELVFTEEKQGDEIKINAELEGPVNGITMEVQNGTEILFTVAGLGTAVLPLTLTP
jgi:hypothetical protein